MNVREFFWPVLEGPSPTEAAQDAAKLKVDLDLINQAVISGDEEVLIEEARRLTDAEDDRRKTAETKATIYLTVAGVLAPILASITPTIFVATGGLARPLLTLIIFSAAAAYLFWSGLWAFRTLQVSAAARLDGPELIDIWKGAEPKSGLAKGLLGCVQRNRARVNEKVTCIKMAHAFGIRAFAAFVMALIFRAAWDPVAALLAMLF